MNKYRAKFECNENTTKKEIYEFLENYKDSLILIHYESNLDNDDDDIIEIEYTRENLVKINDIIIHCHINGIYIEPTKDLAEFDEESTSQEWYLTNWWYM